MPEPLKLKELVTKLNDRNIQRQRESGLTLYAILAVLAFDVFKLIEDIPNFLFENFHMDRFLTLSLSIDFLTSLFTIFLSFKIVRTSRTKIFPKEDFLSLDSDLIPFILGLITFSSINFYTYFLLSSINCSKWIFAIFGWIFAINAMAPIVIWIFRVLKQKKNRIHIPNFTPFSNNTRKGFRSILLIYGIILLSFCFTFEYLLDWNFTRTLVSETLKFSVYLVSFFGMIEVLTNLLNKSRENKMLEQLEIDIYLKNLNDEQIKKALEERYFGQDFIEWVETRKQFLHIFFTDQTYQLQSINLQSKDVQKATEALRVMNDVMSSVNKLTNEITKQVKYLQSYGSLNVKEWQKLLELNKFYRDKLTQLSHLHDHLSNTILSMIEFA